MNESQNIQNSEPKDDTREIPRAKTTAMNIRNIEGKFQTIAPQSQQGKRDSGPSIDVKEEAESLSRQTINPYKTLRTASNMRNKPDLTEAPDQKERIECEKRGRTTNS